MSIVTWNCPDVFPGSLNSNTDIAMIVADAVKETHSVGTAQTPHSVSDTADSDSQSVNCTTLFSLSQMNYSSNHRYNHCYNPLHRSRRFINQYFRLTDQKSPRISLNNHPNEKLFTRNHAMCFAEKSARMHPGCSH